MKIISEGVKRLQQDGDAFSTASRLEVVVCLRQSHEVVGAIKVDNPVAEDAERLQLSDVVKQMPDGVLHFAHGVISTCLHTLRVQKVLVEQPVDAREVFRLLQEILGSQVGVVRVPLLDIVRNLVGDVRLKVGAPCGVNSIEPTRIGPRYLVVRRVFKIQKEHLHCGLLRQHHRAEVVGRRGR